MRAATFPTSATAHVDAMPMVFRFQKEASSNTTQYVDIGFSKKS